MDVAHWGAPQSWRAFLSALLRAQTPLISADNHNKCERLSPNSRHVSSGFMKPDSQVGFINCTARLSKVYWFLWQRHLCSSSPRSDSHRSSSPSKSRWAEQHFYYHIFKVVKPAALQRFDCLPGCLPGCLPFSPETSAADKGQGCISSLLQHHGCLLAGARALLDSSPHRSGAQKIV